MGYLNEFKTQIANRDFQKFLELWEEYCTCDSAEYEELNAVLNTIKESDFAKSFGPHVESILTQWETLNDPEESYAILRLLIDLQTSNSEKLSALALKAIENRYKDIEHFNEKVRLVGLRTKENFQSALRNFDLLVHSQKGSFVFHPGGWGTGEIMDLSPVRELFTIEFENVSGLKQVTFTNAFKSLIPLPKEHFLARRFANPDKLEKEAKDNPIEVVKCLLRDLGPKTGSEIKDELCELVIPEGEWQKWWQSTRAKLKKDTEIESPENAKDPFILRKEAVGHDEQFLESLGKKKKPQDMLLSCYNFIRDHSSQIKKPTVFEPLKKTLEDLLKGCGSNTAFRLETLFCLETIEPGAKEKEIESLLRSEKELQTLINNIEIAAYKKQSLSLIKKHREDWAQIFIDLLPKLSLGLVREYILKELLQEKKTTLLEELIRHVLAHPALEPEFFFWYFQKVIDKEPGIPFTTDQDRYHFAESCLVLLHSIENQQESKDLIKKIYMLFTSKRYALVRALFDNSPLPFAKEFLLLASKCHSFTSTDMKCLYSLAGVVHSSLKSLEKSTRVDPNTFWATEEGYLKTQETIKHIATKEVVENSREVEAARALGDLRENSEYKAAVEKRARLQGQLKALSEQISKARIITPADTSTDEAGIGSIVEVIDSKGQATKYTILGPWETDAERNVLSSQSKFAQALIGLHVDDRFSFKDEEYTIKSLKTIFE